MMVMFALMVLRAVMAFMAMVMFWLAFFYLSIFTFTIKIRGLC